MKTTIRIAKAIIDVEVFPERRTRKGRERILTIKLRDLAHSDPLALARMVVESGRLSGAWESSGDFARRVMGRDVRTVRRYLSGASTMPASVVDRLVEVGVELGSSLIWSAVKPLPLASEVPYPKPTPSWGKVTEASIDGGPFVKVPPKVDR